MEDRAVSLNAVIATIYDSSGNFKNDFDQGFFADKIRALPPVTPCEDELTDAYYRGYKEAWDNAKLKYDRPTGHWIWQTEDKYQCSCCGEVIRVKKVMNEPQYITCPMCDARMVEPQERSDKE